MAKMLPDGRIELSDGRIYYPENTQDPTVRAHVMRDLARTFDAEIGRIIESLWGSARRRLLGMVGPLQFSAPGPSDYRWFTVWVDRFNDHSVTVNLALRIACPRFWLHLSVHTEGVPAITLLERTCALEVESIRGLFAEIDPETLEEPLAQAVLKRLPPASPKHWLPTKRATR